MTLTLGRFLILSFAYSIVSVIILVLSSGGFTAWVIFLPIGSIFYGIVFLLSIVASLILYGQNIKEIVISKKIFFLVIILQVIATLFNYGDCGDREGGYLFYQRLPNNLWSLPSCDISDILIWVSTGLRILFAIVYLVALGTIFWKARLQKVTSAVPLVVLYILTTVTIVIVGLYILTDDYRTERSRVNDLNDPRTIHIKE